MDTVAMDTLIEKSIVKLAFKGELQRKNKLISYERAFKMLENDMYITGIAHAVLELLRRLRRDLLNPKFGNQKSALL